MTVDPTGSTFGGVQTSDEVNLVAGPLLNDTVELTLGTDDQGQLTPEDSLAGNVGVELLPFDDPVSDAESIGDGQFTGDESEFQTRNWGVSASIPDLVRTQPGSCRKQRSRLEGRFPRIVVRRLPCSTMLTDRVVFPRLTGLLPGQ